MDDCVLRSRIITSLSHRKCGNDEYDIAVDDCIEMARRIPVVNKAVMYWIPCFEKLPEMHDSRIMKKLGVMKQSDKCIITIRCEGEAFVESNAELRDGKWYSSFIHFLKTNGKKFEVTAWMPLPDPYG